MCIAIGREPGAIGANKPTIRVLKDRRPIVIWPCHRRAASTFIEALHAAMSRQKTAAHRSKFASFKV
jgi:hypothetical protein